MKKPKLRQMLILPLVFLVIMGEGQDYSPKPKAFIPDIISQFPNVRDIAMSPAGDEIYYTVQSYQADLNAIAEMRMDQGVWSKPEIASFSGKYSDLEPFLAPDGLRLFFVSNRPVDNRAVGQKDYDIWFVQRKDVKDPWSQPVNIGVTVNSKDNEFYPSVTLSNNLYFTSDGAISTGKDDIFVCRWVNGKYESARSLGDSVNTPGYEFNAFIAPDESFLVYTCYGREDGLGSGDLYISYHKTDGHWSAPVNLGKGINSGQMDYCPFVNVRSGILYFTSQRSAITVPSDKNRNLAELLKEMNQFENGQSRLYQVDLSHMIGDKVK